MLLVLGLLYVGMLYVVGLSLILDSNLQPWRVEMPSRRLKFMQQLLACVLRQCGVRFTYCTAL